MSDVDRARRFIDERGPPCIPTAIEVFPRGFSEAIWVFSAVMSVEGSATKFEADSSAPVLGLSPWLHMTRVLLPGLFVSIATGLVGCSAPASQSCRWPRQCRRPLRPSR